MSAANPTPKILIVKMSSLGDLFHALPTVHALKTELNASIDWVTNNHYVELVKHFSDVHRVIGFPRKNFLQHARTFFRELRRDRYDVIIDLQGLLKSAFVARMARGVRRIGPSYHREGAHLFYDEVVGPLNKNRHAIEEALDVAHHLGLKASNVTFPVTFPKKELSEPRPHVAIMPCSRRPEKNWPPEKFVEVGRSLLEKGVTLYLLGAPEDKAVCDQIERGLKGRVVNLCGKTTLVELGSILQEMTFALSVDSGPMHMAAALGIPIVAVFGPTDPKQVGPYGLQHQSFRSEGDLQGLAPELVTETCCAYLR